LNATHWDFVYVSDEVLDKYEKDENYNVFPETGGVSYKNQWSVSRCSRIGRNHIQIELFKLYEGTPFEVIAYWNKYSVPEKLIDKDHKNIAERSKNLVFSYLSFGEVLSSVMNFFFNTSYSSQNLQNLNRNDLNYYGWFNNNSVKPITHHLDHKLSKDAFLNRQKKLNSFLVENFAEKQLRNIIYNLGIQLDAFKKTPDEEFRSIKLLNIILNYFQIANLTGLHLKNDSNEIKSRLEGEVVEMGIIKLLNALNVMRQMDSHLGGKKSDDKLTVSLKYFSIDRNDHLDNYLTACEIIYDRLEEGFNQASELLIG
jgi:hypothetical protein